MNTSSNQKPANLEKFRRPVRAREFNDILINPDFEDLLESSGLNDFERIYNFSGGDVFKNIPDRSVTRIEIPTGEDTKTFYLKRHNMEIVKPVPRIFSKTRQSPKSQGLEEFENILAFRKHGLGTVTPVAAGEKRIDSLRMVSFLLTEDFSPLIALEWLLFNRPEFFTGPGANGRKRVLLKNIGEFARKMHQAGFNHKDFNATHILLGFPENLSGTPEIALFDLQRVDRKNFFRFRWIIKSLAELNYTLFEEYFSAQERERLFLSCKGVKNPGLYGWLQQWWIKRKTARIARHTQNIIKRRKARK